MNYIKREPLLQIAKELQGSAFGSPLIVKAIEEAPVEDVVEVVRCKDCKHATFYSCKNNACYQSIICEYRIGIGDENFFCACGERR